jgi:hypothetical protein
MHAEPPCWPAGLGAGPYDSRLAFLAVLQCKRSTKLGETIEATESGAQSSFIVKGTQLPMPQLGTLAVHSQTTKTCRHAKTRATGCQQFCAFASRFGQK